MLKRCPVSSYDQVHNVVIKELGGPPEKVCSIASSFCNTRC